MPCCVAVAVTVSVCVVVVVSVVVAVAAAVAVALALALALALAQIGHKGDVQRAALDHVVKMGSNTRTGEHPRKNGKGTDPRTIFLRPFT